jgi:hypothetical protein
MLKIIDLDKLNEVGDLVRGKLAFPNLDFSNFPDLELNSTTLLAAYSNISSRVESKFLEGLDWNNKGDIRWQNAKLTELEANINSMILEYQQKPNDFLLVQIFLWIQLWGGNAGRSIFLRGNSWESNFNIDTYKKVINLVEKGLYIDALKLMNTIFGINTAFSTKHIGFWSLTKAPIYDSVIAEIVFGDIDPETYLLDIKSVEKLLNSSPKGTYNGIILVDFAGRAVNLEEFRDLARENNLWIIEDACHAPGASFKNSKNTYTKCGSGEFAELAIFSFHPVKHIACGEGGMITTNSKESITKCNSQC